MVVIVDRRVMKYRQVLLVGSYVCERCGGSEPFGIPG